MRSVPSFITALGLAILAFALPALAQDYPNRNITLIVPYPAGGLSDLTVRSVAQELSKRLGQPVVIDNRAGGSGTIGAQHVLRAPPDGYTLLVNATGDVVRLHYIPVPYDIVNDFTQVGMIAEGPPMVLVVNPSSPHKTVADLAAFARANPGKLTFGSAGPATAIVQFNASAKTDLVDVPYRGVSQTALAIIAGTIDGAFVYVNNAKPLVDDGKLRALAVTSADRSPAMPQLPTMIESGFPGFDINGFVGLPAPPKTPPGIVSLLNGELNAIVREADFCTRFAKDGMKPAEKNSPDDFAAYFMDQV